MLRCAHLGGVGTLRRRVVTINNSEVIFCDNIALGACPQRDVVVDDRMYIVDADAILPGEGLYDCTHVHCGTSVGSVRNHYRHPMASASHNLLFSSFAEPMLCMHNVSCSFRGTRRPDTYFEVKSIK